MGIGDTTIRKVVGFPCLIRRRKEATMANELIEKLEAATGPDRELDCWVQCIKDGADFEIFRRVVPDFHQWACPYYTSSIDAAMSLVPEGFSVDNIMWWPKPDNSFFARAVVIGTHDHGGEFWHNSEDGRWSAEAKSLPLAICIAALKAKGVEG
jgi:hypothetical protein